MAGLAGMLLAPAHMAAQAGDRTTPPAPSYTIRRGEAAIDVDARLDEPMWESAQPIPLTWEWFPGDNVEPPVQTVCRTAYDSAALYIGCIARDPRPEEIRAYLRDRDEGTEDDHFVFLLDPFGDRRRAFQFRVTPLGVQMDAILSQGEEDFSWDTIWESAGRITDQGYVVEVAIPFTSLRFPRTDRVQTWGFIFERSWPRSSRHRIASGPRDRDNSCLLCQANALTGFEEIDPGNDVELAPTLTAVRTDAREDFPAGDLEEADSDLEAGLTADWGVTPNISLSATANPDFSQVEADAAQLDVNQRFALFFPEKRPFFLEGIEFLEVPGDLVFTRTVADPVGGIKVTGKEGPNGFGAFVTRDRINNLVLPGPRESDEVTLTDDVTGAVGRWRRDLGEASTVGTLVTLRDAEGYANGIAGIDGFLRLSPSHSVEFLVAGSRTDYPDSLASDLDLEPEPFGGFGLGAEWSYESRDWLAEASYEHVADDFRADFGFLPQVGARGPSGGIARVFWGDAGMPFNRVVLSAEGDWREDTDGRLLEREVETAVEYEGPYQTEARVSLSWRTIAFAGRIFELVEPRVSFDVQPTGWLDLRLFGGFGGEVDFDNAREADEIFLSPGVAVRIGRPLALSVDHTFQRLSEDSERIFDANLTELRALYHFNVRSFVRAIVQLRDTDRNPGQFIETIEPESRRAFGQLLFSYKVNPQTVLFLGYTDNLEGTDQIDLTRTDRTFFFKIGYAWRL